MTGKTDRRAGRPRGEEAPSIRRPQRYFAVDGGAGAHLLTALGRASPFLQLVDTPRHADLLIVAGPITGKLAPALAALAESLPRPARALVIEVISPAERPMPGRGNPDLLPGARQVVAASVPAILQAVAADQAWPVLVLDPRPPSGSETIRLPGKAERDLATELAVLSLGPVLPFTAGPVRLLLVCDGEQVASAQVDAGYAARGIAARMVAAPWPRALDLAAQLDPLAPLAGQLAYVTAVEQLQQWTIDAATAELRAGAVALERASNQLWWLVRFAQSAGASRLADRAYSVARAVADLPPRLWTQPGGLWMAPQTPGAPANSTVVPEVRAIGDATAALRTEVHRDRALGWRTANIGVLALPRLQAAGVTGPILEAALRGPGDVQSRLLTRLAAAAADLWEAAARLTTGAERDLPGRAGDQDGTRPWSVPAGVAQVQIMGPRGTLGLELVSAGGDRPSRVAWQRPSAAVLALLPAWIAGQKLADAEMILASLDLGMAEADG